MSTYLVEIDPASTLAEVTNAVRFEEAGSAKFLKSDISYHNGRVTNLATFDTLPFGQIPADITFAATKVAAAGQAVVWAGVMVISGTNTAVSSFR
jgi:hypothetical protein